MTASSNLREKAALASLLAERVARKAERLGANDPIKGSFSRYVPHAPTPKQQEFLDLTCKEALYGGAAGGGKSDALLMAALQYVHVPGYSAIIFRRTYQDLSLPDALIPRSFEWLSNTDAHWDAQTHTWIFPSGAKLSFGYCDNDGDEYRYQGAAFQFIGWDELTQLEEHVYTYLFSRLRTTTGVDVPLRVRAATNPGGVGHRWVCRRFIDPTTKGKDAVYVPAKLTDNPHLRDDYKFSLDYLDPVLKARYLDGDWSAMEDNIFVYPFNRSVHVQTPPEGTKFRLVVGGIDPGTADPYAVGVWGLDWDGKFWGLAEMYQMGVTSQAMAPAILALQRDYNVTRWYCDKRRPSDIIDLKRYGIHVTPNMEIHGETGRQTIRPMINFCADLMRAGKIHVSPRMKWHISEFEAYRYHDREGRNAGEVPLDKDNHAVDSMRYCICSVAELPNDRRVRYRSGAHMKPSPRGSLPQRPGVVAKVPSVGELLRLQEQRWEKTLTAGRTA